MPFALFDTPIGRCGVAWSDDGLTRVQLPEATEAQAKKRLAERSDGELASVIPSWVAEAVALLQQHLGGAACDLRPIQLDMRGVPPFHAKVYAESRAIASGETLQYGQLAKRAGSPGASRAVGQAMANNPFPLVVPCHRVLAARGKPGGFSAYGGEETKRKILALEGVRLGARSEPLFGEPDDGGHGLLFDPAEAVRELSRADRKLAGLIEKVGPLKLRVTEIQTPFQALAESIVYQQLHGKAAATILGRVHAHFGGPRLFTPEAVLATPDPPLRAAGLSGAKTAALKDLAAKAKDGVVPTARALAKLEDDEIVERLTTIRGIGRWTVEMLLIFRLGRPDVLPVDDFGVRKGLMRLLRAKEMPTRAELAKRGEKWRPYRSAASWYLWRATELPEGK
jgi:methylated-DNA-[protein]-cysteine S-methyltransferase